MKIVFDKDVLVNALTPAMGAVSEKNTISAIEGILFTTDGPSGCILSSYDLERGYRTSVKAEVLEEGSFIINANKLYRMIRTMPERQITIEVNEKFQTKISSGNSRFSLSALPGNDFPNLPDLNGEGGICFSQASEENDRAGAARHCFWNTASRFDRCFLSDHRKGVADGDLRRESIGLERKEFFSGFRRHRGEILLYCAGKDPFGAFQNTFCR